MSTYHLPGVLEFLTELGFEFHLADLDDTLDVQYPEDLTPAQIAYKIAHEYTAACVQAVKWRAHRERERFIGGPLHGERHGLSSAWNHNHAIHLGRGQWAAYFIGDDGRAFFQGMATNRKKAIQLSWDKAGRAYCEKHFPNQFPSPKKED